MSLYQFVGQNSYAIAGTLLALWAALRTARRRTPRSLIAFAALAAVLALPPLWLRSAQATTGELDRALASGRPTLLEVYSDL